MNRTEGDEAMRHEQSRHPFLTPVDLAAAEPKVRSGASEPAADIPLPPSHSQNGIAPVLWVVVPAVVGVMTAFGFLMCGGILFLFFVTGSSSDDFESQPYAVYSDPAPVISNETYDASATYGQTAYMPDSTYSEPAYVEPAYIEPIASVPSYAEPTYVEPAYAEPVYVEPAYVEPVYVEPTSTEPAAFPAEMESLWTFADPLSELGASITADEQELVKFDAAILAARFGEAAGDVEAQDGETAVDQLFGLVFSVGSQAVEQQLLTERAVVQARLDANRAELVRLRGY